MISEHRAARRRLTGLEPRHDVLLPGDRQERLRDRGRRDPSLHDRPAAAGGARRASSSTRRTRSVSIGVLDQPERSRRRRTRSSGPIRGGSGESAPVDVGSGEAPVSLTRTLTGLKPGVTYDVDVIATNSGGSSTLADGPRSVTLAASDQRRAGRQRDAHRQTATRTLCPDQGDRSTGVTGRRRRRSTHSQLRIDDQRLALRAQRAPRVRRRGTLRRCRSPTRTSAPHRLFAQIVTAPADADRQPRGRGQRDGHRDRLRLDVHGDLRPRDRGDADARRPRRATRSRAGTARATARGPAPSRSSGDVAVSGEVHGGRRPAGADAGARRDADADAAPDPPEPEFHQTVVVTPAPGTVVLLKVKGAKTFVALKAGQEVPLGSQVDVTKGKITLTSVSKPGARARVRELLRRRLHRHPGRRDHRPRTLRARADLQERPRRRRARRSRSAACGATARASSAPPASTPRRPCAAPPGTSRTTARAR